MRFRWAAAARATGIAVWVLLGVAFLLRRAPLLGAGAFSRTASALLGQPELAAPPEKDPVRVFLGTAERAPARSPGPKAVLDPVPFRRPPRPGPARPDAEDRLVACAEVFAPSREEGREVLRAFPAARARSPAEKARRSWDIDQSASEGAIAIEIRAVARKLPASFLPGPALASAAASVRVELRPREVRLDLPLDRTTPPPPAEWPAPDRPLRVPEVFVDVLEAE